MGQPTMGQPPMGPSPIGIGQPPTGMPMGQQPMGMGQPMGMPPMGQQPVGMPGGQSGVLPPGVEPPGLKEVLLGQASGFPDPRKDGLTYLGICIVAVVAVFGIAVVSNRVFIYPAVLGPFIGVPGLFLLLTGEPRLRPAGEPSPLWAKAGLWVATIVGGLLGLATLAFYFG